MVPLEYLEWIFGRPEQARYDLGSSDLRDAAPDPGQVVPDALADLPDPGTSLRAQVAAAYGVDEDAVMLTAGATHANVLAFASAVPGTDDGRDRVLVERPAYEPLWRTPRALGAAVDRFRRPREDGYPLSADRVAAAADGKTALVVASNRHNPSGRLADRADLAAAAEAAAESGATLLVDEVYAPYTDETREGAFGGPTAAGLPNVVVTGSLTKFHGLGGLRVGWLVGDPPLVERVRRASAHVPALAAPSRALARRALGDRDRIEPAARERLRENHDLLAEFVADRAGLDGRVFRGASFAFLAHETADGDEVTAAAWERDLLVVPGRFFGDDARFRVSLGGDPDEMAAALSVLGDVLDAC